ncbi:MAG TPA: di-heme oxidoredictase family protein [Planctomycetota bacterium]|nr:di-heme oxidoredictase family protein [Planctomycetota bacterium]
MRRLAILLAIGFAAAAGIVPEGAPIPPVGDYGGPRRPLDSDEQARFLRGRALFDRDFFPREGLGPVINCDSCRACHQDPILGGSGGIDVQVQRPMMDDGRSPVETGAVAQLRAVPGLRREEMPVVHLVEERNSPTLLGLGLVQGISDAAILAREDPDDLDGDGIRGIAHRLPDGTIGRLGWKAIAPDVRGFVRDAFGNEMGMTVPLDAASPFGILGDGDAAADPEIDASTLDDVTFFLEMLAFTPRRPATPQTVEGEQLFAAIGCAKCHVPVLDGVEAYSDVLLHDVEAPGFEGVAQGEATSGLYRTPPLRGLRDTAPYFHDGRSPDVESAVRRHGGEALAVRQSFEALSPEDRAALLAFLVNG